MSIFESYLSISFLPSLKLKLSIYEIFRKYWICGTFRVKFINALKHFPFSDLNNSWKFLMHSKPTYKLVSLFKVTKMLCLFHIHKEWSQLNILMNILLYRSPKLLITVIRKSINKLCCHGTSIHINFIFVIYVYCTFYASKRIWIQWVWYNKNIRPGTVLSILVCLWQPSLLPSNLAFKTVSSFCLMSSWFSLWTVPSFAFGNPC